MAIRLEGAINQDSVGFALIITNDYKNNPLLSNLEATESDGQAMKEAFDKLGYSTLHRHNVTQFWLISALKKIDQTNYPPSCNRIAFVFAGHGREPKHKDAEEGTQLVTNEGNTVSVNTVVKLMSPGEHGSTLNDKVRMFFIDACRGDLNDIGKLVHRGGKLTHECRITSAASNYILCYSTLAGFRSYEIKDKDKSQGIWLPVVAEKLISCNMSINDVMTEVNSELMKEFQDKERFPLMMQPNLFNSLNTRVNLYEERPSSSVSLCESPLPSPTPSSRFPPINTSSSQQAIPTTNYASPPSLPPITASTTPTNNLSCVKDTVDGSLPQLLPIYTPPALTKVASVKIAAQFSSYSTPPLLPKQPMVSTGGQQMTSCRMEAANVIVPSTQSTTTSSLIHRNSTQLPSGQNRDILNQCVTRNIITSSYTNSWKFDDKCDEQSGKKIFRAQVTCILVRDNSITITGDSQDYYVKKGVAQEKAAESVVKKLEQMEIILPGQPIVRSVSYSPPSSTTTLEAHSPKCQSSLPGRPESRLIYKQEVNNHFQGKLMLTLPIYNTHPVNDGFQCVIHHPQFPALIHCESITGQVRPSKKEAENSAAWNVWIKFKN